MTLTTRDLGETVEVHRREYHIHAIDGLPDGLKAVIVEERGAYRVSFLDVVTSPESECRQYESIDAALDEVRRYAISSLKVDG